MKNTLTKITAILCFTGCLQSSQTAQNKEIQHSQEEEITTIPTSSPHKYGGWYCPDNLRKYPAVDISQWQNVPVVNGRMPTKEEAQTGISLIFVDREKYPNAKPLDMKMPRLATFFNHSSQRKELIILIQAVNITNDSIVGFRYLNGGNGSARLSEVNLLTDKEITSIPDSRFVTLDIAVTANQEEVWKILTNTQYSSKLQPYFDPENKLPRGWRKTTNMNFHEVNSLSPLAEYAEKLYGNFYIQNDYNESNYTQKIFLSENKKTKITTLKLVFGPYLTNYETKKTTLTNWGEKVKELSQDLRPIKIELDYSK